MARLVSIALVLLVHFFARSYGQQVEVPRDPHHEPVAVTKSGKAVAEHPKRNPTVERTSSLWRRL